MLHVVREDSVQEV